MEQFSIPIILDRSLHDIISVETNSKNKVYKALLDGRYVFIKQAKDDHQARQEYVSQFSAYETLKSYGLNVPQPITYHNSWVISEYIDGTHNNAEISGIYKSLQYLHKMHHADPRGIAPNGHYYGDILSNRLREEQSFLSQAMAICPELNVNLKEFDKVLHIALEYADLDEPVLGHGDFQPKNIIIRHLDVYPVDWLDFGLVLRWYELGNLLFLQKISTVEYAVKLYLQLGYRIWNPSKEKLIKASISIAGIIRTGSYFREVVDTGMVTPEILANIKLNMDYIKSILN